MHSNNKKERKKETNRQTQIQQQSNYQSVQREKDIYIYIIFTNDVSSDSILVVVRVKLH